MYNCSTVDDDYEFKSQVQIANDVIVKTALFDRLLQMVIMISNHEGSVPDNNMNDNNIFGSGPFLIMKNNSSAS